MNGLTSLKRYQIAKVYRRDNPSKGRYREFYQCDFDIAGPYEKMAPDFEVVRILTELLEELEIGDFEIKLNHRKLLDGMMQICGVPPEKFRTICSSIDKLDKQPFEQIRKEMVDEKGLTAETADRIGTFVKEKGHPLTLLSKLKQEGSAFIENAGSVDALNDLEILFNALDGSKRLDKVVFDLSLARGLDYYTGVIFEAVFKGGAQVGSIAAGGRYDNLIGMFGSKQVPAVGVSLGIERVFVIMEQNQTARPINTKVLVSILGNDVRLAGELAGELWDARVKAEFLVNKRIQKHFDYATKERIFWMILVDEKQIKDGTVQLKRLEAGKYVNISNPPRENFVEELKKWLKTEVLVSILGNDVRLAGELADELWDARVKADFLVSKREQKHLDYATKERIPWMILVDEQQIKNGTVQLKHLEADEYVNISNPRRENFVEELQTHLTQSSKSSAGPETKLQKEKDAYQMQPLQQQIRD